MSTRAIIAYKDKSGKYFAKYSHYGAIYDYGYDIKDASDEKFIESVNNGSSSEPFEGFYNDKQHCLNDLHWTIEIWQEESANGEFNVRKFDKIDNMKTFGNSKGADIIYIRHLSTGKTTCLKYNFTYDTYGKPKDIEKAIEEAYTNSPFYMNYNY